ncbi:MAG TPA: hypothetical protein VJY84_00955 [Candidatus Saccharimonadales bacterium]|nr:hypothetical protein [Candidatus Saccharimonadales bacterium]
MGKYSFFVIFRALDETTKGLIVVIVFVLLGLSIGLSLAFS